MQPRDSVRISLLMRGRANATHDLRDGRRRKQCDGDCMTILLLVAAIAPAGDVVSLEQFIILFGVVAATNGCTQEVFRQRGVQQHSWSVIYRQARSQITGDGHFLQILDIFQGLKIGVPSGCPGKTSILKVIMIDDVTLWSKLEYTW